MLKHAGMFEFQPSMIPAFNSSTSAELQWRSWIHREAQNRYATDRTAHAARYQYCMHLADRLPTGSFITG